MSDQSEIARGGPLPPDHVLGVGPASMTVAQWTPRRRVGRALDLGTGCGVQALHLAGHSGTVVATDLSERALAFARFTTALAEVPVDLRAREPARPGRERTVRPRREQPAVRHHARDAPVS